MLDWVRHGVRRAEIARRRGTTVNAVKYHLANITGKLGVSSTRELRHWPGYPVTRRLSAGKGSTMATSPALGRLGQVSLLARDSDRVEGFYRDVLGLPHLFTFGDLVFFDCDGTRLFIRAVEEREWRASSILYFVVEDIRAAHEELQRREVRFQGAPHLIHRHDDGDEEWMAFFEDREGNTLALMSRVAAAGREPA